MPGTIKAAIDELRSAYEAAVATGREAYREVASSSPPPGGWPER